KTAPTTTRRIVIPYCFIVTSASEDGAAGAGARQGGRGPPSMAPESTRPVKPAATVGNVRALDSPVCRRVVSPVVAAARTFVTWPMEPEARAILERLGPVETSPTEVALPEDELAHRVALVEAIIPMGAHPVPERIMLAAPRLRVVGVAAVGYNLIDVGAATRRGVLVTNTPGVLTETTADMAWALMLAAARRVPEGDRFVRAGQWKGVYWSLMMGADVHGTTLGVIGAGRIGKAIVRRAHGFGMRALYSNRRRDAEAERLGATYRE